MQRDQIRSTLKTILENEIGEVVPDLPDDTNVIERFGLDSVDVVSLVMHVERHFRVRVAHEELAATTTVGGLLDLIAKKVTEATATGGKPSSQAA
jgi:acyl carrier protein